MKFKMTMVAATLLSLNSMSATAGSEIETLINMLHENGMVSDEQYGRLVAELKQNQTVANEEKAEVTKQLAEATKPSDVDVKFNKGALAVNSRDGKFNLNLGGRVQADAAVYSGDPDMGNGTEIRRGRIYISGTMYHDWGYKLEYEFANTGANGKGITDAYLTYNGFDDVQVKVGNFKDPFSLEYQASSKYILFTERSLAGAFIPGRHMGVMASTKQKHWSLATAVFGDSVSTKGGAEDEGWGFGTRATFAPINEKTKVVHFGLGLNYRDTGDAETARFKSQPETHIAGINIVDTSTIANVDDYLKLGVEAAASFGPLHAQAEYTTTSVSRSSGSDLDFDGWYVQTGYFITGESRKYKKGAFSGVTPKTIVGEGGIGAWELGLRYSSLDLSDSDIDGGEVDSVTLGLNWYATPSLRFSANYVDVLDVDGGANDNDEPSLFQVRSQWAF